MIGTVMNLITIRIVKIQKIIKRIANGKIKKVNL